MKRIISLVVSAAVAVTVLVGVLTVPITASATLAAYAVVQSKLSRAYTLKTHNDADFTATVKLNGNKLAINGRFVKYTLSGIYLTTSSVSKAEWTFDVSSNADGTCSTELTAAPTETSGLKNAYIRFVFKGNSNYTFKVTVEYDMIKKEWFFGDNGTEKNNQEYIKRAVTLGADALKDYILPDGTDTQILAVLNKLNDTVTKLTGSISGDYEKAARISEYIGNFMYYDHDSSHGITTQDSVKPSTVSISHILDTKRSVCVGYANMFAAMCELAGVKTLTIIGCVPTSQRTFWDITDNGVTALHNWNLFYADGAWHNVDSLWDAPTRGYNSGEYSGGTGSFPFYFDMTDAAFAQLHRIDTRAEYRDYKALLKDSPDGKDPNITVKTPDTATTKNTGVFTPPTIASNGTQSADNTETATQSDVGTSNNTPDITNPENTENPENTVSDPYGTDNVTTVTTTTVIDTKSEYTGTQYDPVYTIVDEKIDNPLRPIFFAVLGGLGAAALGLMVYAGVRRTLFDSDGNRKPKRVKQPKKPKGKGDTPTDTETESTLSGK